MKRSERHHLKENEVALWVAQTREQFETHRSRIVGIALLIVLVAAALGGYFWWARSTDKRSRAMLVEAMTIEEAQVQPPQSPAAGQPANANQAPTPGAFPSEQAKLTEALRKYMAVAEAYPSTKAGIAARYHAASCLAALGRTKEAIDRYREVVERAGNDVYGDMARLGLADAQVQARQFDAAIAAYRELTTKENLPTDAVLMQLGRAYSQAGRKAEARQSFQRILDEFPQSQYAQVAKRELDAVKPS